MTKIFSGFVFLLVAGAVTFSSYIAIKKGLEKDTNIGLLSQVISQNMSPAMAFREKFPSRFTLSEIKEGITPTNSCDAQLATILTNTNSVADFLYFEGQDYSFTKRSALAAEFKIDSYRGSAEQNILLLSFLRKTSDCYKEGGK